MDRVREYVSVNATFREDGMILPTEILWEDGRVTSPQSMRKI